MVEQSEKAELKSELQDISGQLLSKLTAICKNDLDHIEVIKNIKRLIKETFEKSINYIIFGTTCSGKSSVINSLISLLTNKKYMNLLPTSICENTTGIMVIQNSEDEYFHYIEIEGGQKEQKELQFKELKELLQQKNEKCEEELKKFKETKDLKSINEKEKYEVIKIPNASKNFTFIDTPGMSNSCFLKYLENLLTNKNIIPIFINVINLNSVELINENLYNILKTINLHFLNSTMYLILTQADLVKKSLGAKYRETINDEEDESELDKNQEKRKQAIMQKLNIYLKFPNIKIGGIFLLNPFLSNKEITNKRTENARKDVENFYNEVDKKTIQSNYQTKISFFTSKLIYEIHKYEKKKIDSKCVFDSHEIFQIIFQRDTLLLSFQTQIKNFIGNFPQTVGELKNQSKFFSQKMLPKMKACKGFGNKILSFLGKDLDLNVCEIDENDKNNIARFICLTISDVMRDIIQSNYLSNFPETIVQKIRAINNHHCLLNETDSQLDLHSGLLRLSGFSEKDLICSIEAKMKTNQYQYFSEAVFGIFYECQNFVEFFSKILINLEKELEAQVELTEFSQRILSLKSVILENQQENGGQEVDESFSSLLTTATEKCKLLEKDKLKSFFLDISDLMTEEEIIRPIS